MNAERLHFDQAQTDTETIEIIRRQQAERESRLTEVGSPVQVLGDLTLRLVMGGALVGGGVFPATEAATLEMMAGVTEFGDNLRRAA